MGRIILDPQAFAPSQNISPRRQERDVASQWMTPGGVTTAVKLASLLGGLRLPRGLSDPAVDAEGQALQFAAQKRAEAKQAIEDREVDVRRRTEEMTAGDFAAAGPQQRLSADQQKTINDMRAIGGMFSDVVAPDESSGAQGVRGSRDVGLVRGQARQDQRKAFSDLSRENLTREQFEQARPDFMDRVGTVQDNQRKAQAKRKQKERERMPFEDRMREPAKRPDILDKDPQAIVDQMEQDAGQGFISNLLEQGERAFSNVVNKDVETLQQYLLQQGYGVEIDGKFGDETLRAMRAHAQDLSAGQRGPLPMSQINSFVDLALEDLVADKNEKVSPVVESLTRSQMLEVLTDFRKNRGQIINALAKSGGDTQQVAMYEELLMKQVRRKSRVQAAYDAGEIAGFEELGVRYPGLKRRMTDQELTDFTDMQQARFMRDKKAEDPYFGLAPADALEAIITDAPSETSAEGQRKLLGLAGKYTPRYATFGDYFFDTRKDRMLQNAERLKSLFPEIKTGPTPADEAKLAKTKSETDKNVAQTAKIKADTMETLQDISKSRGKKRPKLDKTFERLLKDSNSVFDDAAQIRARRFNLKSNSNMSTEDVMKALQSSNLTAPQKAELVEDMALIARMKNQAKKLVRKGQEAERQGNFVLADRNYKELMKLLYQKVPNAFDEKK